MDSKENRDHQECDKESKQSSAKGIIKEKYQKMIPNNMLSDIKSDPLNENTLVNEVKVDVVQQKVVEGIAKPVT